MKFGMNLYVWTTELRPEFYHVLPLIKDLGYDGVEVPVSDQSDDVLREIRYQLDNSGLSCTTITNVGVDANPISPDAEIRRKALERLKRAIDASYLLESENLVGPFFSAYGVFTGKEPTVNELLWSAEVMRDAASYARRIHLTLSIEWLNRFEIYLLTTTSQAKGLVKLVDQPNFGILYDTHHAHIEENSVAKAIVADGAEAITHVHFSENQRGTLGEGAVNWGDTVSALKHIGYDQSNRWVMAEAFNKDVPGLREAAHVWRNCFDTPEQFARDAIQFMRHIWS